MRIAVALEGGGSRRGWRVPSGGDGHLGELEGNRAGVAHDTRPDLDQLELQAGQRPVGHGLWQLDAAHEGGQIVGQRVQLQPHLVVAELPAG